MVPKKAQTSVSEYGQDFSRTLFYNNDVKHLRTSEVVLLIHDSIMSFQSLMQVFLITINMIVHAHDRQQSSHPRSTNY